MPNTFLVSTYSATNVPLGGPSSLVTSVVQDPVDLVLEGLPERVAGRGLELVGMRLVDDFDHVVLGLLDGGDNVRVRLRIGNGVADADGVALEGRERNNNVKSTENVTFSSSFGNINHIFVVLNSYRIGNQQNRPFARQQTKGHCLQNSKIANANKKKSLSSIRLCTSSSSQLLTTVWMFP